MLGQQRVQLADPDHALFVADGDRSPERHGVAHGRCKLCGAWCDRNRLSLKGVVTLICCAAGTLSPAQIADSLASPFELLAGNHESYPRDGYYKNYRTCLPDRLAVTGSYQLVGWAPLPEGTTRGALLGRILRLDPEATRTHHARLAPVLEETGRAGLPDSSSRPSSARSSTTPPTR